MYVNQMAALLYAEQTTVGMIVLKSTTGTSSHVN